LEEKNQGKKQDIPEKKLFFFYIKVSVLPSPILKNGLPLKARSKNK
jgi:hypothetical protein